MIVKKPVLTITYSSLNPILNDRALRPLKARKVFLNLCENVTIDLASEYDIRYPQRSF